MKLLIMGLMIFTCLDSLAFDQGGFVGNGGDAVTCTDDQNQIISAELLDFYEGRTIFGKSLNLPSDVDVEGIINLLLERTELHDDQLRSSLQPLADSFFDEAQFLLDVDLQDIPDSDHIALPHGCKLEQIAIQRIPKFPGEKRYVINQKLWDQFDAINQAGLVLHELLFRLKIESQSQPIDSRDVRFFNIMLSSNSLSTLSFMEYIKFVKYTFGIQQTRIMGYEAIEVKFEGETQNVQEFTAVFQEGELLRLNEAISLQMYGGARAHISLKNGQIKQVTANNIKSKTFAYGHWNFQNTERLTATFNDNAVLESIGNLEPFVITRSRDDGQFSTHSLPCKTFEFREEQPNIFICRNIPVEPISFYVYDNTTLPNPPYSLVINSRGEVDSARALLKEREEIKADILVNYSEGNIPQKMTCTEGNESFYVGGVEFFCFSEGAAYGGHEVEFYSNGKVKSGGAYSNIKPMLSNLSWLPEHRFMKRLEFPSTQSCQSPYNFYQTHTNGSPKYVRFDFRNTDFVDMQAVVNLVSGEQVYASQSADIVELNENQLAIAVHRCSP